MSGLGGFYNFDDRPADQETLVAMGNALAVRAPDGGNDVCSGSIGITYRAFHTNKESRLETQPLISPEGHLLTWDGRLDNREELLNLLRGQRGALDTDVGIVMTAYRTWGIDFLPKLIGDFALSLYDSLTRSLILARDVVGTRTLFYHIDKNRIIWSTELKALIDCASIELKVDEEYVADYLAASPEPFRSPYIGIQPVPPGYVVIIRNGKPQTNRFWGLNPHYELRYKTDAEYEEHFRSLLRDAVKCRLRVNGPVWAELSGGLDSSSIVCMADEILRNDSVQATKLETVSYVSSESHSSDETPFIRTVEKKTNRTSRYMRAEDYPMLAPFEDEDEILMPSLLHCFARRYKGLQELMVESGARVLVTGQGGDEVNCSKEDAAPELADLLLQRKLKDLHRRIQTWSQVYRRPYLDLLWKDALQPLFHGRIKTIFKQRPELTLPSWFDKRFVTRMNLAKRLPGPSDVFNFRLPSDQNQSAGFLSIVKSISAGSFQERCRLEFSHPYLHRPLVEFLQAIPQEQRVRPGEARSLMRRALRDLLPEQVAKRRSKGGPDEVLYRTLAREWPRLEPKFRNAHLCVRGYMDARSLQAALSRARHGCEPYTSALIRTLSLEFWLRALEGRKPELKLTPSLRNFSAKHTGKIVMATPRL
jgi:asparagine synthase (glutamine-hydrolysing)